MGIESPVHLLFLAAVALIVLGPKRLPALAKALGQGIREFRESLTEGALGEHPVERAPTLAPGQVVQVGQAPPPSPAQTAQVGGVAQANGVAHANGAPPASDAAQPGDGVPRGDFARAPEAPAPGDPPAAT